jgi:SP family myo-inositol transporter-like MFS transporter 13
MAAGMLVAIHQDLGHSLSSTEQEVIVSATTVGAILGALVAGRLSDRLGRRKVMITAGIFFTLGSMEQAASQVLRELILGRFLVGIGVGMSSMIVPTYLAECSPTSIRGQIISINSLLITGGQVIAYMVNAGFYNVPHGWRWMVLSGGIPALVQLMGLLFYLDESPRWLISQKRNTSARLVLAKIYPLASQEALTKQMHRIERSLQKDHRISASPQNDETSDEETTTVKVSKLRNQLSTLWNNRQHRKALFLACGLQAGQQLIGANSILYFSSRLLLMAGFHTNPNLAAVSIAVANLIGTVLALRLVDRIGRRRLLLNALAASVVTLVALSIALSQVNTGDVTDSAAISPDHPAASAWAYVSLTAVSIHACFR